MNLIPELVLYNLQFSFFVVFCFLYFFRREFKLYEVGLWHINRVRLKYYYTPLEEKCI